jgi:hypothetical protein
MKRIRPESEKMACAGLYMMFCLLAAALPDGYGTAALLALLCPVLCFLAVSFYREVIRGE